MNFTLPNNREELSSTLDQMRAKGATNEQLAAAVKEIKSLKPNVDFSSKQAPSPEEGKLVGGLVGKLAGTAGRAISSAAKGAVEGFKEGEAAGEAQQKRRVQGFQEDLRKGGAPVVVSENFKKPRMPLEFAADEILRPLKGAVTGAVSSAKVLPTQTDESIAKGEGPIKAALSGGIEASSLTDVVGMAGEGIAEKAPKLAATATDFIGNVSSKFNELDPATQATLRDLGFGAELALDLAGGTALARGAKAGIKDAKVGFKAGLEAADKVGESTRQAFNTLVESASKQAEKIIPIKFKDPIEQIEFLKANQGDAIKQLTVELPKLDPAFRRQLAGKDDLVEEYIARTVAANARVDAPSPLSFGAERATEAMNKIEDAISNTGTQIGAFRDKIATVKGSVDQIQPAITLLDTRAKKLGFVPNEKGMYVVDKSRKPKLNNAEVSKLNEMRGDLVDLKGDPKVQMIIDVRSKVDSDIKFLKDRQDITDKLDPVARDVRSTLAEVNRDIIGKEQAALLEEYSALSDVLYDFRKMSSKGKNNEFFIKRVMSERDRLPKEMMSRIKEITGIDLLDDAVLVRLTTDNIGNQRLKGLFEQEIADAGITAVESLLTKNTTALATGIVIKGLKKLLPKSSAEKVEQFVKNISKDENRLAELEEIIREASKKGKSN